MARRSMARGRRRRRRRAPRERPPLARGAGVALPVEVPEEEALHITAVVADLRLNLDHAPLPVGALIVGGEDHGARRREIFSSADLLSTTTLHAAAADKAEERAEAALIHHIRVGL